jgi:hypothetical protein
MSDEFELTMDQKLSQVILRAYHGELLTKDVGSARIRFANLHSATSWASTNGMDGWFEDVSYVSQPCTLVVKMS